jgi:hypothetical protein
MLGAVAAAPDDGDVGNAGENHGGKDIGINHESGEIHAKLLCAGAAEFEQSSPILIKPV